MMCIRCLGSSLRLLAGAVALVVLAWGGVAMARATDMPGAIHDAVFGAAVFLSEASFWFAVVLAGWVMLANAPAVWRRLTGGSAA